MAKWAKIENDKVVNVVSGLQPAGYLAVIQNWVLPTAYPTEFYNVDPHIPRHTVVSNLPEEDWSFALKSVADIKLIIHDINQIKFDQMVFDNSFMSNGETINVDEHRHLTDIFSLHDKIKDFKVHNGNWIALTAITAADLRSDLDDHVQVYTDLRKTEFDTVEALIDHDGLKTYWLANIAV